MLPIASIDADTGFMLGMVSLALPATVLCGLAALVAHLVGGGRWRSRLLKVFYVSLAFAVLCVAGLFIST